MVTAARLEKFRIKFLLGIDDNNIWVLKTKNIDIGDPEVSLTPGLKTKGICGNFLKVLFSPLLALVELAVNFISAPVLEFLEEAIKIILDDTLGSIPLYLPTNVNLGGLGLSVKPNIASFSTDGSPATYIEFSGGLSVDASLSSPDWRRGNSLSNDRLEEVPFPEPTLDRLVNIHMGAAGVNSLVEPIWYLAWATLARDKGALDSPLCQDAEIATDPCPFPPVIRRTGAATANSLRLAFILSGLFRRFEFHFVLKPPQLDFQDSQKVQGSTSAQVVILGDTVFRGRRQVAIVDVTLDVEANIPVYNSADGTLSDFRISEVEATVNDIKFIGRRPLRLAERAISGPVVSILNELVDKIVPLISNNLKNAVEKIPIKVPDLNISALGILLTSEFANASAKASSSTGDLGSFVELGSDFVVEATDSTLVFPPRVIPCNVYDSDAYELALEDIDAGFNFTFDDIFFNDTVFNDTLPVAFNETSQNGTAVNGTEPDPDDSPYEYYTSQIYDDDGELLKLFELRVNVENQTVIEVCSGGQWVFLPPPESGSSGVCTASLKPGESVSSCPTDDEVDGDVSSENASLVILTR